VSQFLPQINKSVTLCYILSFTKWHKRRYQRSNWNYSTDKFLRRIRDHTGSVASPGANKSLRALIHKALQEISSKFGVELGLAPNIWKGINIFTVDVIKDFPYNYDRIIPVLWKKGNKKKKITWKCLKWCHMAHWNFACHHTPQRAPTIAPTHLAIEFQCGCPAPICYSTDLHA